MHYNINLKTKTMSYKKKHGLQEIISKHERRNLKIGFNVKIMLGTSDTKVLYNYLQDT